MKQLSILICLLALSACATTGVRDDQSTSEIFMKAESAYAKKDYKLAKQHYQSVIAKYPDNIGALFKLANISMREKDWNTAMDYYTIILSLKPTHAKAHHNLAMLHLNKAKNHLNYYIAHNNSMNNMALGKLIESINDYSYHKSDKVTSLDRLADIVKH